MEKICVYNARNSFFYKRLNRFPHTKNRQFPQGIAPITVYPGCLVFAFYNSFKKSLASWLGVEFL
ncbi:hypothetical protein A4D02_12865 [Niastella koreensis]|uniref:Uncharacterized protein n=1 Tax=Niastella koreensis TaxID=354356 RepID=A0ABX3NPS2_9BACT|nr:hypothetical protein A4D02_12865 [Niastella koreensis]